MKYSPSAARSTKAMETDEAIAGFISKFESCTLPKSEWTHACHLIMALWYLRRHPASEAEGRIREGIQHYNLSQGNLSGYHETITRAWISVISRFLTGREPSESIAEQAGELLRRFGARDYLLRHYSRDLLFSDTARRSWLEPDREPFDPPVGTSEDRSGDGSSSLHDSPEPAHPEFPVQS